MTTTTKYALRDIRQRDAQPIMCEKVTIDGFDYYVSDEEITQGDYYIDFRTDGNKLEYFKKKDDWVLVGISKKVISTNLPYIELPKVVDDYTRKLAQKYKGNIYTQLAYPRRLRTTVALHIECGFYDGYNQSQQTHPFSEEDMINFGKFLITYWKGIDFLLFKPKTKQEILQLWKEQKPITIYYDSGSNNSDNA